MTNFDQFHAFLLWFYALPMLALWLISGLDWRQRGEMLLGEAVQVLLISLVPVFNLAAICVVCFELVKPYRNIALWHRKP